MAVQVQRTNGLKNTIQLHNGCFTPRPLCRTKIDHVSALSATFTDDTPCFSPSYTFGLVNSHREITWMAGLSLICDMWDPIYFLSSLSFQPSECYLSYLHTYIWSCHNIINSNVRYKSLNFFRRALSWVSWKSWLSKNKQRTVALLSDGF